MIVAVVFMIVLTFCALPIFVVVELVVDFDKYNAKLALKIARVPIFRVTICMDGSKLSYHGTINGQISLGNGSKKGIKGVKLEELYTLVAVKGDVDGLKALMLVEGVSACAWAVLKESDVKFSTRSVVCDVNKLIARAKCKFSVLSLCGVVGE